MRQAAGVVVFREETTILAAAACAYFSTLEDKDFVEHEVSRRYGITVKYGVELISTLSSPGSLVWMVAKYGYLCT
jgi:hypothetical protein